MPNHENRCTRIQPANQGFPLKNRSLVFVLVISFIRKSEHHCKCEFSPEGLLVFIIRALKCFKSEKFFKNSGDFQSRILIDLFEKCTDIQIDEIKFKKIIQS